MHNDPSQAGIKLYVVKLFLSESILKILEVNEKFLNDLRNAVNNRSIRETCQTMLNHVIRFIIYKNVKKNYVK